MKKFFTFIALLPWGVTVLAQIHTVARGENLQSIAAKYNVTEAQLISANPGVDKLFYVGLKLNIPESARQLSTLVTTSTVSQTLPIATNAPAAPNNDISNSGVHELDDKPGFNFLTMLEYGFLPKIEGAKSTNYTYSFTVGGYYYFMHRLSGLFAGARIGYNSANYNTWVKIDRGNYYSSTSEAHFITIPISAGYTFATKNRYLAVIPYVGIDPNFCVAGKYKHTFTGSGPHNNIEGIFKKKVGFDARLGLQLRIFGVHLGVAYVIPLNDEQKSYFGEDSYIGINLGFGF